MTQAQNTGKVLELDLPCSEEHTKFNIRETCHMWALSAKFYSQDGTKDIKTNVMQVGPLQSRRM